MTETSPYFTEEHRMLRAQLRRFVAEEVRPHGAAWEAAGRVPREVLRRMGELGFLGIRYEPRWGGAGMDALGSVVLAEELGRSTFGGFAITVLVHTDMASVHVAHGGSAEQQARWMPGIVAGETITAVAVTEPGAGSDVKGIATRAEPAGGGWRLNGAKTFITNGVEGDLICLAARTGGERPSRALSMFAVERGTPGLNVARELDKQGWRSSDTAELVLEDCFVPAENLLGTEGGGFAAIMRNFQNERLVIAAMAMAEAETALEITLDHVKTRRAFGALLWQRDAIRQKLAMLAARVAAARALIHQTAWRDGRGEDCVAEVSMLKALCGELVNEVMYACVQCHGGTGYMEDTPINRMARDARVHAIGGGATEVMLEEVAKRM